MHAIMKSVLLIGLAGSLGGCQILNLPAMVFKSRPGAESKSWAPAAKTDYAAALSEGRFALSSGNLSEAAALFRIAQGGESTYADATNGIAVAYAKLGRPDIAERYFRMAIDSQPENPKFAANLLRLQQDRDDREPAPAASAHGSGGCRSGSVGKSADGRHDDGSRTVPVGALAHATRGMVHITTPHELAAAPAMTVESREVKAVAKAESEQPEELEVEAKQVAMAEPQGRTVYPIRIELGR